MANASAPLVFPVLSGRITPISTWDTCESGWVTGGNVVASTHSGNNRLSTQTTSQKIVSNNSSNVFASKARAITGMDSFDSGILVYYQGHDFDSTFLQDTRFDFGTADSAAAATSIAQIPRSGWNFVPFQRLEFSTALVGAQIPYFATKTFTSFELRSSGNATPLDLYIGGVFFGGRRKGRVMFHIDDPWTSAYDNFVTYADPYGWKLNIFVTQDLVATTDHMTLVTLAAAKARGYRICNHSKTHGVVSGLTGAQLLSTELSLCAAYLTSNGLNTVSGNFDTAYCYAAPFGFLNQAHIDAVRTAGYWMARTTLDDHNAMEADAVNPWGVGVFVCQASTTIAQIRQTIRLAAARGSVLRILIHEVVNSGAAGSQINLATFKIIVEEVRMLELMGAVDVSDELTHRVQCGSITQWW